MTSKQKKNQKKTSTTAKKNNTKKTNQKNTQNSFADEIKIWITLAVSILILISNFGFGGFIGETIASFLSKVFGICSYLIPFLLFGAVAFIISNRGNTAAYIKVTASVFLLIFLCIISSTRSR